MKRSIALTKFIPLIVFYGIFNFLFVSLTVGAETDVFLTYEQAAHIALDGHPQLMGLRAQEEANKLRSNQALAPNNPVVSISNNDVSGFSPFTQGAATGVGVAMTLGFPGKALLQSRSLEQQAYSQREQSYAKEVEILTQLSSLYVNFYVNAKRQFLLREELHKSRDTVKMVEQRYAMAQVSQIDVLNARLFLANIEHDMLVAEDEALTLNTQFRGLLRLRQDSTLRPTVPQVVDIPDLKLEEKELIDLMLRNRHQLRSLEYLKESAITARNQAAMAFLPDFQLQATVNDYHISTAPPVPDLSRDYSFQLGIAVPIFFPWNEMNGVRAANQDLVAAELQRDSEVQNAISDLQGMLVHFKTSERQRKNLESFVLRAAGASYDLAVRSYAIGKADYLRLKDALLGKLDAEKDHLARLQESAQVFNQITQQVGCDFLHHEAPHACR